MENPILYKKKTLSLKSFSETFDSILVIKLSEKKVYNYISSPFFEQFSLLHSIRKIDEGIEVTFYNVSPDFFYSRTGESDVELIQKDNIGAMNRLKKMFIEGTISY